MSTMIIYGPHRCGKTRNAAALAKHFRCVEIRDDWHPGLMTTPQALHLTNSALPFAGIDPSIKVYSFLEAMHAAGLDIAAPAPGIGGPAMSGTEPGLTYGCGSAARVGDIIDFGSQSARMLVTSIEERLDDAIIYCGSRRLLAMSLPLCILIARHGEPVGGAQNG